MIVSVVFGKMKCGMGKIKKEEKKEEPRKRKRRRNIHVNYKSHVQLSIV